MGQAGAAERAGMQMIHKCVQETSMQLKSGYEALCKTVWIIGPESVPFVKIPGQQFHNKS